MSAWCCPSPQTGSTQMGNQEDERRGRGCVGAELNVLASNPARELYESVGFEVSELKMRLEL